MPMESDSGIAERVARLYPTVAPELGRYLRRLGVAPSDVDDLVSDAFRVVLELDDEGAERVEELRPYLFGVARNLAMRLLRSRSAERVAPNEDLDRAITVPDETARNQSRALARRAFFDLQELDRRILWLTTVERRPSSQVGLEVGLTATNVNTRAQRARSRLREGYISSFLEKTPPACGTSVTLIAQYVTKNMGRREMTRFRSHAQSCSHCASLILDSRTELAGGSLLGIVLIGGLAGGIAAAGKVQSASAATSRPTTARLVAASSGALVIAVAAVATLIALSPGTGETPPPTRDATSTPSSPPRLVANPATVLIDMPAPGHASSWTSRVTNTADTTANLYLIISHSDDSDSAAGEFTVTAHVEGVLTVDRSPLTAIEHPVRLGSLSPGMTVDVDGLIERDRRGTQQTESLAFVTRYVSTDTTLDDLTARRSGVLDIPALGHLAETGGATPSALLPTACALSLSGALLLVRARRRARPESPARTYRRSRRSAHAS